MSAVLDRPTATSGVTLDEFLSDERYGDHDELILGIVWPGMPESTPHLFRTDALQTIFRALFPDRLVIREAEFDAGPDGRPRPDVVVFRECQEVYVKRTSLTAADVLIVIEVVWTTHDRDLGPKDVQYARAGVPEYVIVDLKNRLIEVRTEPFDRGYLRRAPLGPGDSYRGVAFGDLLGPEPS